MTVQPRDTTQNATSTTTGSPGLLGGDDSSQFMQLLMTELQSQDPMSPMDTDSTVTQLVQLNLLDQVTQIRELVQSMGTSPGSGS